jgi:hypothetical protein
VTLAEECQFQGGLHDDGIQKRKLEHKDWKAGRHI